MKKHERRFAKLAKKWRKRLWLDEWSIKVDFEDAPDPSEEFGDHGASSSVTMLNRYRSARFTVFNEWAEADEADQDRIALHEVAHLLLAPIASHVGNLVDELKPDKQDLALSYWTEVHEEVTTKLENVLWHAFDGDKEYKKNG